MSKEVEFAAYMNDLVEDITRTVIDESPDCSAVACLAVAAFSLSKLSPDERKQIAFILKAMLKTISEESDGKINH